VRAVRFSTLFVSIIMRSLALGMSGHVCEGERAQRGQKGGSAIKYSKKQLNVSAGQTQSLAGCT